MCPADLAQPRSAASAILLHPSGYGRHCIFRMAELAVPRYLFRRIPERWPTMFDHATSHDLTAAVTQFADGRHDNE
jgi:hypothetical protein